MTRRRLSTQSAALSAALAAPTGCAIVVPDLGTLYVPLEVEAEGGAAIDTWLRGLGLTAAQLASVGITAEESETEAVPAEEAAPALPESTPTLTD